MNWVSLRKPGYFGRKRDAIVAELNREYSQDGWRLVWLIPESVRRLGDPQEFTFFSACRSLYEESYFQHLRKQPEQVDIICSYGECYDNAVTNVDSGLDYMVQESYSTHIQDIAVRNVLRRLDRWFTGPEDRLLQIRSKDSAGYQFGPGNIPFFNHTWLAGPSLCPTWAKEGSVEDFWQSNKWIQVKEDQIKQRALL